MRLDPRSTAGRRAASVGTSSSAQRWGAAGWTEIALGHTVAIYHRSSTLYQIHSETGCPSFRNDNATEPRPKATVTPVHWDPYENALCQVRAWAAIGLALRNLAPKLC
jgi:hypothetical protein